MHRAAPIPRHRAGSVPDVANNNAVVPSGAYYALPHTRVEADATRYAPRTPRTPPRRHDVCHLIRDSLRDEGCEWTL